MPNSRSSASPRPSSSQSRRRDHPSPTSCSDVPTTQIYLHSNLSTPTTSVSGCESKNHGDHGPSDVIATRATLLQVSKPVVRKTERLRDVHDWCSKVEQESPNGKYPCLSKDSKIDPAHIFGGVEDELSKTAVEKFKSMQVGLLRKRSISPSPDECRKRSRLDPYHLQDPLSAGLRSHFEEQDALLAKHLAEAPPRIWPCPFFIRDRGSYRQCWTRHCLLSLSEVREHLLTVHLEPIHCSVCYGTFQTVKLRDEHMRSRECHFELSYGFEGLRDSQIRDLQKLGTAGDKAPHLQERQWGKMWCIVFSCTRLPHWPFSFSQQELAVYEFRRFWESHGEHIVASFLKKYDLQQYEIEDKERSLEVLFSRVADHAVDRLLPTENT